MAQYWLEITSAADLSRFATTNGGTLSYVLDGSVPTVKLTLAAGTFGQHVVWLDVPSVADAKVAILSRSVGSFAINANGAALRIAGANAYVRGQRGGTSTTRRIYYSNGSSLSNVTLESSTGSPANNIYAWRELSAAGTTLEARSWLDGESRPESADMSGTHATLTSGQVGFGRPGDGTSEIWVSKIAVGTDGDPAPTGPVAGERQRSRLILTPW